MKGGNMKKRGLSAVVTTLIIILLVLVAVGGIWVVVNNFIDEGTEQIDLSSKCRAVDLSAVSVNETSAGIYDVTIHRSAGGDAIGGIKINIFNSTGNSGVIEFGTAIAPLGTNTQPVDTIDPNVVTVTNANKLEYTAYFLDASGSEQLCSTTNTYDF